jgi:hypothetical protein
MGRRRRDEAYALDFCDQAIGSNSVREAKLDWLLGDPGKDRRCRKLPVDAYWPDLGLVVEFWESQHEQPVPFFDKPDQLTVSGIPRSAQRALYDQRRLELIPRHNLSLFVIRKSELECTPYGRLTYAWSEDLATIRRKLETFVNARHTDA